MMNDFCNYYGRLQTKLYGDNLVVYMIDEAMKRILDKHEAHLIRTQERMVSTLKKTFDDEIGRFTKEINKLVEKVKKQLEGEKSSRKLEEVVPKD